MGTLDHVTDAAVLIPAAARTAAQHVDVSVGGRRFGGVWLNSATIPPSEAPRPAPLVAANDPLPAEIIAAANLICHGSGDLLMRASSLCGAMHRPVGFDRLTHALDLMAREAQALAKASRDIGAVIRALQARAAS